jgi:hypothetical protein
MNANEKIFCSIYLRKLFARNYAFERKPKKSRSFDLIKLKRLAGRDASRWI